MRLLARGRFLVLLGRAALPAGNCNRAAAEFCILPPFVPRYIASTLVRPVAKPSPNEPQAEEAFRLVAQVERNALMVDAILRRRCAGRADLVDHDALRIDSHRLGVADSGLTLGEAASPRRAKKGRK